MKVEKKKKWKFVLINGGCAIISVLFSAIWAWSIFNSIEYKQFSSNHNKFYYTTIVNGGIQVAKCRNIMRSDEPPWSMMETGWRARSFKNGFRPEASWQIFDGFGKVGDIEILGLRLLWGDLHAANPSDALPYWSIRMPLWIIVVSFGVLPIIGMLRMYKRIVLIRRQLCPNCRYDVRMSSDRCPECGSRLDKFYEESSISLTPPERQRREHDLPTTRIGAFSPGAEELPDAQGKI